MNLISILVYLLLDHANTEAASVTLATASKDRTLRLWKVIFWRSTCLILDLCDWWFNKIIFPVSTWKYSKDKSASNPTKIRAFKILKGHGLSVQSVASQTSGDLVWLCSCCCVVYIICSNSKWKLQRSTHKFAHIIWSFIM